MKNATFDGKISLFYPDDFYEMNEEEMKRFFGGDMLRFGARNAEKHIILSLTKSKKSFLNIFASSISVLAGVEHTFSSNLKDYNCLDRFEFEMFSKKGNGIRFTYLAIDQDVKQYCEMTVVKYKNNFYVSYCLSRFEDKQQSEEVFKSFRDSLRLIEK